MFAGDFLRTVVADEQLEKRHVTRGGSQTEVRQVTDLPEKPVPAHPPL
ncbi:MAG: hypothetical protein U5K76_00340 [Woeseiaceae bacterium]|nr:hypothetical protein [Woeseiaceae bacterium]